jgi:hypothetical protein
VSALLASLKQLSIPKPSESWRAALVVHVMSLVTGFFLLLWLNRNQWFVADEWHFLVERGFGPGKQGLFEPANEHWSTIPILIYRGLFSLFGVRTYAPYVAVLMLLHVGVAHLVWRVMRSSSVGPWIATAACAMFLLLAAGFENIQWAYQIGFIGSLLFGLGHVLLADHSEPFGRRDVAGGACPSSG